MKLIGIRKIFMATENTVINQQIIISFITNNFTG